MDDNNNLLIISCIFGKNFKYVYPAPSEHKNNCIFFSNNISIQKEIELKGWKFYFIPFELSDDNISSSLQSKYIKFLQFLNDYPDFKKYKKILYFDHKVYLKKEHLSKLNNLVNDIDKKYCIIIRNHEEENRTLLQEIDAANNQERYKKNMDKIINLINNKISKKEIEEIKICNTGLIYYINYEKIMPMLNDIYNMCIEYKQPECQIIWGICSQNYLDNIYNIHFHNFVKPLWKSPENIIENFMETSNYNNNNNNLKLEDNRNHIISKLCFILLTFILLIILFILLFILFIFNGRNRKNKKIK